MAASCNELHLKRPTLDAEQAAGVDLLWAPKIDTEAQRGWRAATVRQQPYVYQPRS